MVIQNSKLKIALWVSFFYGAGAFLSGKFIQHFFHVKPCALCLYQQFTLCAIALAGILAILTLHKRYHHYSVGLVPLLVLINFVLASYHVGVEQHIFPVLSQCHGNLGPHHSGVEALRDLLLETDIVPCDKIKWTFLGISMASYNALFSFIVLFFWISVLRSRRKISSESYR